MTRVRIPSWGYWGGGLASLTATLLCLMIQFGHVPNIANLLPLGRDEAGTVVFDEAPPSEEASVPPIPHDYSLYYADAGRALIVYGQSLIVVNPGSALPDGSHAFSLSPNQLVTSEGRTLRVR